MVENEKFLELIEWLKSEKCLVNENSTTMGEEFENKNLWELSKNMMIIKTISKIEELIKK